MKKVKLYDEYNMLAFAADRAFVAMYEYCQKYRKLQDRFPDEAEWYGIGGMTYIVLIEDKSWEIFRVPGTMSVACGNGTSHIPSLFHFLTHHDNEEHFEHREVNDYLSHLPHLKRQLFPKCQCED